MRKMLPIRLVGAEQQSCFQGFVASLTGRIATQQRDHNSRGKRERNGNERRVLERKNGRAVVQQVDLHRR